MTSTAVPATPAWVADLTVEQLDADTDRIFERLRREAPFAWVPALHGWAATTWELCREIGLDGERFRGGTNAMEARLFGQPMVLGAEGEVHTALREAAGRGLQPREFKDSLEARIRPMVREQLATVLPAGRAEMMHEYVEPVSVLSVADALGFHELDAPTLQRWFHTLAMGAANTPDEHGEFDPHGFDDADGVREEVRAYLTMLAERERANPSDGPVGHMFRAGMPDGELRDIEFLLPTVLLMFLGGLQEPGHAVGVTLLGLMSAPEQLQRVIAEPQLIGRAVAEGLRWMSPLYGGASRTVAADTQVAGHDLKAGDHVWLIYGSANVDAGEFERPTRFDLDRARHPHLAFGIGRHSCLGSAFAPQAARIVLEELFAQAPNVRLDEDHPPAPMGWMFRGSRELHLRWD